MTAKEFAEAYAQRGGTTVERLKELGREPRPCTCDYIQCEGWQMTNAKEYDEDLALTLKAQRSAPGEPEYHH